MSEQLLLLCRRCVDAYPGFTYELCAGLIDKGGKSNEEIASEVRGLDWAGGGGGSGVGEGMTC